MNNNINDNIKNIEPSSEKQTIIPENMDKDDKTGIDKDDKTGMDKDADKNKDTDKIATSSENSQSNKSIDTIIRTTCINNTQKVNTTTNLPSFITEKYTDYNIYVPLKQDEEWFTTSKYLTNIEGEKLKTQEEIDLQFLKDTPRRDFTINTISNMKLYDNFLTDANRITPNFIETINSAKTEADYFNEISKVFPTKTDFSEEEKRSIFNSRKEHLSTQPKLGCYIPWFDKYMDSELKVYTNQNIPSINDIKVFSQQGVWGGWMELIMCYYTSNPILYALQIMQLSNPKKISSSFSLTSPIFQQITSNFHSISLDLTINAKTISWVWKNQFVLFDTDSEFGLAVISGVIYIDWATNVYFLWDILWTNPSVEKFYIFLKKMTENKKQGIYSDLTKLANLMKKYVFNKKLNQSSPKNIEAIVNFFISNFSPTDDSSKIQEYIKSVENINATIRKNIEDGSILNDKQMIQLNPGTLTQNITTNNSTTSSPTNNNLTTTQSIKTRVNDIKNNLNKQATQLANQATQLANSLSESTVSDKIVAADEAVTLGSILAGMAFMAPLMLGGSLANKTRKLRKINNRKIRNKKTKKLQNKKTKKLRNKKTKKLRKINNRKIRNKKTKKLQNIRLTENKNETNTL